MRVFLFLALVTSIVAAQATSKPKLDPKAVERGRKVFLDTQDDEYASCADCHNIVPEKEEIEKAKFLGPGGTLYGSAMRQGWRNSKDRYKDVVAASDPCAKTWQERDKGLSAEQKKDLGVFLQSIAGDKKLPMRKVRKPKLISEYEGGDAAKGEKTAMRYCGQCHNPQGVSFPLKPNRKRKHIIVRKVRGYNAKRQWKPSRGTMGWYSTERLSDKDLLDIVAYLGR
ncbi:MAG: cytochrome c [Planctomycetota bacterium]